MKLLPWIICAALIFIAASPHKNCREKAISDTLNMTLLVGADMRAQGKKPTWAELQAEVRKRLHVK